MNPYQRTQRALLVSMFVSSIPATLIVPMLPSLGTAYAGYLAANVGPNAPFAIIFFCVALAIVRGIGLVRQADRKNPGA